MQTAIPVRARTLCVIEWSADLSTWTTLQSGTANGGAIQVSDATNGLLQRFYRMRITN